MNVIMVLLDHAFPPDIRVENELSLLNELQISVFLLTLRNHKNFDKMSIFPKLMIYRIEKFRSNNAFIKYFSVVFREFFMLIKLLVKKKSKLIHVHDLPYGIPTILLGKFFRKKIIFDMHENYVDLIRPVLNEYGFLGKITLFILKNLELFVCGLSDKIIVVTDDFKKYLIKMGIPKQKISVISNFAPVEKLEKLKYSEKIKHDKFIISYVGGFSEPRGLDILIRAFSIIAKKKANIVLYLVGDGYVMPKLRNLVNQLELKDRVIFTGWVPFDKAMQYIQMSHIGVIPYKDTLETQVVIPHKLFQYMFYAKPIIASDLPPLKKIIANSDCGILFEPENIKDLAEKLWFAITNYDKIKILGSRGRKAILTKYNIQKIKNKLYEIYKSLT